MRRYFWGEKKYLFLIILFFGIFLKPYANDKIRIAAEISKSVSNGSLGFAQNLKCDPSGFISKWGEEPPIFHFLGSVFTLPLGGELYYNLFGTTLILILFLILIKTGIKFANSKINYKHIFLPLTFPIVFLYSNRPLPDTLSTVFLSFFIYYKLINKKNTSYLFGLLACTTKILAIFPLFFFMISYHFFVLRDDFKKILRLFWYFVLCFVPTIFWFIFLFYQNISNPFFSTESFTGISHLSKNGIEILLTGSYWFRIFKWTLIKGMSIPMSFTFFYILFYLFRSKIISDQNKVLITTIISQILYAAIVRGQMQHPWYSFYYIPFYFLFIFSNLSILKNKSFNFLLILGIIFSLPYKEFSFDVKRNFFIPIDSIGWTVPCPSVD